MRIMNVVTLDIIHGNEDHEPRSFTEYRNRHDWIKWKDTIQVELNLLNKWKAFGPMILMHEDIKSIGYKWVFVRKKKKWNYKI